MHLLFFKSGQQRRFREVKKPYLDVTICWLTWKYRSAHHSFRIQSSECGNESLGRENSQMDKKLVAGLPDCGAIIRAIKQTKVVVVTTTGETAILCTTTSSDV